MVAEIGRVAVAVLSLRVVVVVVVHIVHIAAVALPSMLDASFLFYVELSLQRPRLPLRTHIETVVVIGALALQVVVADIDILWPTFDASFHFYVEPNRHRLQLRTHIDASERKRSYASTTKRSRRGRAVI